MGLIAREVEARGIPTVNMTSALSITAAANPPRGVYLDYPLGHTTGKPNDPEEQYAIMAQALAAFSAIQAPGTILELDFEWRDDDSWKDRVMRPQPKAETKTKAKHEDDRVARFDTPQYQSTEDAEAADPACPTCVFLNEEAS